MNARMKVCFRAEDECPVVARIGRPDRRQQTPANDTCANQYANSCCVRGKAGWTRPPDPPTLSAIVSDFSALNIPQEELGRRAVAWLRGYAYQIWTSARAWSRLRPGEALLLEGADDYGLLPELQAGLGHGSLKIPIGVILGTTP